MLLHPAQASFAKPFQTRLKGKIDVILLNPPYVPTEEEEFVMAQKKQDIECSWAGGLLGMQVTNAFLQVVAVSGLRYICLVRSSSVFTRNTLH